MSELIQGASEGVQSVTKLKARIAQLERVKADYDKKLIRARRQKPSALAMNASGSEVEEEGWLMAYLDVMTLMLVLLIVMLAFAHQAGGNDKGPLNGGAGEYSQQSDALSPLSVGLMPDMGTNLLSSAGQSSDQSPSGLDLSGLSSDVEVVVNETSISFRISSEILYASGSAVLSREGKLVLDKLVPILKKDLTILVEGHTDNIPINTAQFPSNWELSGFRASSVVRHLESQGVPRGQLRPIGFADNRPLTSNETAEGRAQNRRVEINVRTRQPD